MHDDSTAILRAYTEEAVSKSRRNKGSTTPKKKNGKRKGPSNEDGNEVKSMGMDMSRMEEKKEEDQLNIDSSKNGDESTTPPQTEKESIPKPPRPPAYI